MHTCVPVSRAWMWNSESEDMYVHVLRWLWHMCMCSGLNTHVYHECLKYTSASTGLSVCDSEHLVCASIDVCANVPQQVCMCINVQL